jgi:hypothetical protein
MLVIKFIILLNKGKESLRVHEPLFGVHGPFELAAGKPGCLGKASPESSIT